MRFKPGKLTDSQRDYIIAASHFLGGTPIPFAGAEASEGRDTEALQSLVTRGLMTEYKIGLFDLTPNGFRVARAIHDLAKRPWRVAEIDAHLTRLGETIEV